MDDKIKILEEYMNSLNYGMYIPNSSTFFIRYDEKENSIELILDAIIGIQYYSESRIIKYDCNNFKFYSYTGKEEDYKDKSVGNWIKKYEEAFKDKCNELFEDKEMEDKINELEGYMKDCELPGHFRLSVEYDECTNKVILLWSDFMLTQFIQGKVCGYNIDKKYLYSLLDQDKPIPDYYEYVQYKFSKKCDELFNKGEE